MKFVYAILIVAAGSVFLFLKGNKPNEKSAAINIPNRIADKEDANLHIINGVYYYGQQLFSGIIKDVYENGKTHHETSYYNGREEAWSFMYYADGTMAEKRYYHQGEKDSVHTGWWPNGKLRFEYHFSKGMYNGDYKEWYNSGQAYKHIHYASGVDDWGKGWRENGRLFMNYTMVQGRRYGIVNSNLCYTVKNEQGEFTKTTTVENKNGLLSNSDNTQR